MISFIQIGQSLDRIDIIVDVIKIINIDKIEIINKIDVFDLKLLLING